MLARSGRDTRMVHLRSDLGPGPLVGPRPASAEAI